MKISETQRLYLREFTCDDAEQVYLLNMDEDVLKFTGDKAFNSVDHAQTFLENYDHYTRYGYGRWAVIDKSNGAFLGWCGLKYSPELGETDVGFRFFKKYWNQGFATESARASIALGFEKYNLASIVGRAMNENTASIRVLEKTGLLYAGPYTFEGEAGVVYKIDR